ncbi:MAG TPA: response regulator transcription factor [Gaiellaceae bacterium]|nr:response regulator transcription factor [Gaiellaceae bacterium]
MRLEGSIGTGLSCVVADRHPEMLESLALLLEHEGFTVVGKASTGRDAVRFLETRQPDLLVLDLRLGAMTGIDVARAAARLGLTGAIVLHTSEATPKLVREALDAGVGGIAREAVPPTSLLKAIAAAVARELYIDPAFGDPLPGSGQ